MKLTQGELALTTARYGVIKI